MKRFIVVMALLLVIVLAVACPTDQISQAEYVHEDSILASIGMHLDNFKAFIESSRDQFVSFIGQDFNQITDNKDQILMINERLDLIEEKNNLSAEDQERIEALEDALESIEQKIEALEDALESIEQKLEEKNESNDSLNNDSTIDSDVLEKAPTLIEIYPDLENHQYYSLDEIEKMVSYMAIGLYGNIKETIDQGEKFSIDDKDRLQIIYFILNEVPMDDLNEKFDINIEKREDFFDDEGKMKESYFNMLSERLFDKVIENDQSAYGEFYSMDMPLNVEINDIEPLKNGLRIHFNINAYVDENYIGQVDLNASSYPLYSNFIIEKVEEINPLEENQQSDLNLENQNDDEKGDS